VHGRDAFWMMKERQDEMVPESEFIRARDGVSDDALNNLIPF
jgi:hypothetical protein